MSNNKPKIELVITELTPYNEFDLACKGGYYVCPNCGKQQYISETTDGKEVECSSCEAIHVFKP